MKILLIDDEPFVLKLLEHQLVSLGYQNISTYERALDALARLEVGLEKISLIFCDLQMPEIDGVEFVRHLVRIHYDGALILISGEDERILHTAERLAKAHKLQVLGSLQKPVSRQQLKLIMDKSPSLPARGPRKIYSHDELQEAITNGHLVNYYQPQVEIATGRIAGVETLVRWQHPQDGLVYPDQFITTAEDHGLIDDLTRTVLTNSLQQARQWIDAGLALHVAVNVSMDNLVTLNFADFVADEVGRAGIPLASLVLEVTESRLMKDPLAPLDILTRLRLKHIGLSIDDFGTGHSSLAQLRDIPFNELKVDRGFVHGASHNASLRAIVEASLDMAQHLGMQTVAEGVENWTDWNYLRTTSCDLAQGYFIARPMPAEELPGWIVEWESRFPDLDADQT